ncbi:DivIVA domain-containing protein [Microbacterium sp. STN6]|uniref:DivIVA domain-containing protein n=1 Tax=Microbacterium sp. STN6 TaxID=2995588 RepID=UPI002260D1BC|nr:DivIVA domain-containing protein [Microbacterium sp. STN6]MCX7521518.1 DivIVA domain-containing protein [Microbacterium sp. STN6]
MALTPEDVVNKRFQPTKFREGYDQDEVDDFLDEVVVELRRLNQENEELKQRLVASDSRIAELQRAGNTGPQAAAPQAAVQPEPVEQPEQVAAAPVAAPVPSYAPPASAESDTQSTNNLLQLARRLHEEHVREGIEKRDALVAEGHATAARIVAEAESKQREQISRLDAERTSLENRIEELRTFERDYRQQLRGYIEGQLRELEANSGTQAGHSAPSSNSEPVPVSSGAGQAPADGNADAQQPPTFQGFGV